VADAVDLSRVRENLGPRIIAALAGHRNKANQPKNLRGEKDCLKKRSLEKENFNITKDILQPKKQAMIGNPLANFTKIWHI